MHAWAALISGLACLVGLFLLLKPAPRRHRTSLPVEVQLRILDLAAASLTRPKDHKARLRFLLNFALVARGMNKEVQPHLWHTLRFTSQTRLLGVLRLLGERRALRACVRVVDLRLPKLASADALLAPMARRCPDLEVLILDQVSSFYVPRLARWPRLRRLHFRNCSAFEHYNSATGQQLGDLTLPRLTDLTSYGFREGVEWLLPRAPVLQVLGTDESVTLSPALATQLAALATPKLDYWQRTPLPDLPACRVALLPPKQYDFESEPSWHAFQCPKLRFLIAHGKHRLVPGDLACALRRLETVYQADGATWWGARGTARAWGARRVRWVQLSFDSGIYCRQLNWDVVEHFVEVADRVIAEEVERARRRAEATTDGVP